MPSELSGPWHLFYPFISSLLYVVGAMLAKKASVRGASPYTNTVACNFGLMLIWVVVGTIQGLFLPSDSWAPAACIACAFVLGQLCTYFAFEYGDVSLATPILGVKIIFVAVLGSFLTETPLPLHVWIAAILASVAVAIVQMGEGGSSSGKRRSSWHTALAVMLALLSAFAFSCFDLGLQTYGPRFGAMRLLATMFVFMGLISCVLLPWVDRPSRLHEMKAVSPLLFSSLLIGVQAISVSYALGQYGDATRVNIIYSLRGIWSVLIAWMLNRLTINPEGRHSPRTMWFRLSGAILLLICVIVALN